MIRQYWKVQNEKTRVELGEKATDEGDQVNAIANKTDEWDLNVKEASQPKNDEGENKPSTS